MTTATLSLVDDEGRELQRGLDRGGLLGFALLWSRDEPERVGEVCLVPSPATGSAGVIGRDPEALGWQRLPPGRVIETGPLTSAHVSRQQLALTIRGPRLLEVRNLGRSALLHDGQRVTTVRVSPGDLLEIHARVLLMCIERLPALPLADPPLDLHPFAAADRYGIVGESPTTWDLREQLAFIGPRAAHVLIRGVSGTGKELAAQAIHASSPRAGRPLIARNAATFPESLVDAELFGNAKGYPQAGMPERPGLVGEAEGSSLFLDEFAELPQAMQAHLLRVLDAGEYTRLGEARPRRSDFRLIAATNRPEHMIKEDVLARMRLRIELPGLEARREDIPLIANHLLRALASKDRDIANHYFPAGDPTQYPRISRALIEKLVRHRYTTHVRELETMLWKAMAHSRGDVIDLWPLGPEPEPGESSSGLVAAVGAVAAVAADEADEAVDPVDPVDPNSLSPEQIQACLDRHEGRQEPAWRELGLSSRHVLTRLVRRYDLRIKGRG